MLRANHRLVRLLGLTGVLVLAFGCSGSSNHTAPPAGGNDASVADGAPSPPEDGGPTPHPDAGSMVDNVVPMVVNDGPPGTSSVDVPFVSITLCVPGTTTCKTIDYVSVDTGSSGLRILASALPSGFALPQQKATTGNSLAECFTFADGYTWGSVRVADVKIGGEVASKGPLQLIGDPAFASVPSACSSTGPSENTLATFGSNGLIGINQIVADCGDYCSDASDVQPGGYYS